MTKYATLLLLILLLTGCKKDRQDLKHYQQLVGEFDWTNSQLTTTTIYSKENSDHQFGIRIRKNGKVFLYEQGKLVNEGVVSEIIASESSIFISLKEKPADSEYTGFRFYYGDSGLTSVTYPFPGISNTFQKK